MLLALRLHTGSEPLERDIVIHAALGNELLHGRALYVDLWNHKPPASFLVHAAFNWLFGFSEHYILVMNVVFNMLTLLGLFLLVRRFTARRWLAVLAAFLWVLLSYDLPLQANQPNSEALVNPLLVFGILLWHEIYAGRLALRWSVAAGLLFFSASYFKQQYALIPMGLALGMIVHAAVMSDRQCLRRTLRSAAIVGAIGIAGWGIAFLHFWLHGSLRAFLDAAFFYNEGYGGDLAGNLLRALHYHPRFLFGLYPYVIAALAAIAVLVATRRWRTVLLLLGWMLGTHLAVALPGKFFPHYFQLWIPVLVVATACLLDVVIDLSARRHRMMAACIVLLLGGFSLVRTLEFVSHNAWEWASLKQGTNFAEARVVGDSLVSLLPAGERVFYVGNDPSLYLYGNLRPVAGVLYAGWFARGYSGTYADGLLAATLKKFEQESFDIVVLGGRTPAMDTYLMPRLQREFTRVRGCLPDNELWVRRGSRYAPVLQENLQQVQHRQMSLHRLGGDTCAQAPDAIVAIGTLK